MTNQQGDEEMYDPEFPTPDDDRYDPEFPTPDDDRYDPEFPTPDDDAMEVDAVDVPIDTVPAPTADVVTLYGAELDPNSDRLQSFANGQGLWHRSMPGCYIATDTGEFIDFTSRTRTGHFFLKANLFRQRALDYGDDFYLVPIDSWFDARSFADSDANPPAGAVYVPWRHIMQHTYDYMSEFDIKETHTFWPSGTTESDVLAALVDDLNNNTGRTIVWQSEHVIKTFFLRAPTDPSDKYTADQMSDLCDLVSSHLTQ